MSLNGVINKIDEIDNIVSQLLMESELAPSKVDDEDLQKFKKLAGKCKENAPKVRKALLALYQFVKSEIGKAYQKSRENKKPLLILYGESHYSLFCALAEMVTFAAAYEYNIRKVLGEFDDERGSHLEEAISFHTKPENHYKKIRFDSFYQSFYYPFVFTGTFLKSLMIKYEPMDFGLGMSGEKSFQDIKAPEKNPDPLVNWNNEMRHRNKVMAGIIKKHGAQDLFAIVGWEHQYGLIQEEKLYENYEILALGNSTRNEVECFIKKAENYIKSGEASAGIRDFYLLKSNQFALTNVHHLREHDSVRNWSTLKKCEVLRDYPVNCIEELHDYVELTGEQIQNIREYYANLCRPASALEANTNNYLGSGGPNKKRNDSDDADSESESDNNNNTIKKIKLK